jgi:hypothetical protein
MPLFHICQNTQPVTTSQECTTELLKALYLGGIRTRVFCSACGWYVHCATPPTQNTEYYFFSLQQVKLSRNRLKSVMGECRALLTALGFECMASPGEAEATCAQVSPGVDVTIFNFFLPKKEPEKRCHLFF